jgi:hypothetical protein
VAKVNPFKSVAILLRAVADSLEDQKREGQAPRWLRINRVRNFYNPQTGEADAIAKGVIEAAGALLLGVSYMQRFTLEATDLLMQGDAAKALMEVSADLVKSLASTEFINALEVAVGQPPSATSPLSSVGSVVDTVMSIAEKVPEPEDLQVIGEQLYRLLAIETISGALDAKATEHVELGKTGKLRLLQLGFAKSYRVQGLGKNTDPVEVSFLGVRRLGADASTLASRSTGIWGAPNAEVVFDLSLADANAGKDIEEANKILQALGYGTNYPVDDTRTLSPKFAERLKAFQKINGLLPVSGTLDNATVARLMHLDLEKKNLKRAKPFRADALA